MNDISNTNNVDILDDVIFKYIYTDKANTAVINSIKKELPNINFIVRDEEKWDIRYITNIITDPSIEIIVIHEINDLSIAEITLASFMCKQILCITDTIKEYTKIYDMINDIQSGCNLTINNNSFSHWYKSRGKTW